MSLPPLIKHIYNYGTEEVIRRGKKIFHMHGVSLLDKDQVLNQVRFRVRNDLYQNHYTVTVNNFNDEKKLAVRCQCPYNIGEICRHEVAALFHLNDLQLNGYFLDETVHYDQKHTGIRMRKVSLPVIKMFSGEAIYNNAAEIYNDDQIKITDEKSGMVEAKLSLKGRTEVVKIRMNDDRFFDTSCGCDEKNHPLCLHKALLFMWLLEGTRYDDIFGDAEMIKLKNTLLAQYGYSLNDDISGKFQFSFPNGKPVLRVVDSSIKKLAVIQEQEAQAAKIAEEKVVQKTIHLGIVLSHHTDNFPYLNISLVQGELDKAESSFVGTPQQVETLSPVPSNYNEVNQSKFSVVKKFQLEELMKYLRKNLPFGELYDDHTELLTSKPNAEIRNETWQYLLPKYKHISQKYHADQLIFLSSKPLDKPFTAKDLKPIGFSQKPSKLIIKLKPKASSYFIQLFLEIGLEHLALGKLQKLNAATYINDDLIYFLLNDDEVKIIESFDEKDSMTVSKKDWPDMLANTIVEWNKKVQLEFDERLFETVDDVKPGLKLYLEERDRSLVIKPVFTYANAEVAPDNKGDVLYTDKGKLHLAHRQYLEEERWLHWLVNNHSDFHSTHTKNYFLLSVDKVLLNNWFFRFIDTAKEKGVEMIGGSSLRQLKVTNSQINTRLNLTAGTDWYDAEMKINFDEQEVELGVLRQALLKKQTYVRLADGSLGNIPKDWLEKYSLLIKMSEVKDGKLRINKYHFNLLNKIASEETAEELERELEQKKQSLMAALDSDIHATEAPPSLKTTLRPYQLAGVQWLTFLNNAGWGGILADDMGLGKTIQALAFFMKIKEVHPSAIFLVVCPTTLVYNWENEIKKFTPTLKHHIHHGPKRATSIGVFNAVDIVITTYGTMRSDIKFLKEFPFEYVVLDESQAIKNPSSQVAKASLQLNSKNRIALSGTPLQNNTFDLYAQLNFLNPGMLGSKEFFNQQFAAPIDKLQDKTAKAELRQVIYPFLLRRTKEQVAKDLPEKTETILYCEMGDTQRKIYEEYRDLYRVKILGMIESVGMDKSRLHVLQGLTRLRQLCNSPAILKEQKSLPDVSVKNDELLREITDNVSNHKALVFSQFLGMLDLIKKRLDKVGIKYAYFDGSSSMAEREKNIQEFQENPDCKIFLISLKAGGIGLNLTAADYVYIVDPWWNPAVEQQAIDRTHRIGQTKNIFAYRLICKDSIEEKMLLLQDQKKVLAADLVSDDNAILKKLTKEDINFLFS